MNNNAPTIWHHHNRAKSLELAAKVQSKLKGKVLKQINSKTWVYCYPDEEPKPIQITGRVLTAPNVQTKTAVQCNGITYKSVKEAAEKLNFTPSHLYRMLNGTKKNTIGIKYASGSKNESKFNHLTNIFEL